MDLLDYRVDVTATRLLDGHLADDVGGMSGVRRRHAALVYQGGQGPEVTVGLLRAATIAAGGHHLVQAADALSQEAMNVAETITDASGAWLADDLDPDMALASVLIIETVEIAPAFRGRRLGPLFLAAYLEHVVEEEPFTLTALQAAPLAHEQLSTASPGAGLSEQQWAKIPDKIARSWRRIGFTRYAGDVYTADLMYRDFSDAAERLRTGMGMTWVHPSTPAAGRRRPPTGKAPAPQVLGQ